MLKIYFMSTKATLPLPCPVCFVPWEYPTTSEIPPVEVPGCLEASDLELNLRPLGTPHSLWDLHLGYLRGRGIKVSYPSESIICYFCRKIIIEVVHWPPYVFLDFLATS